eukprot:SAG22_NODE_955_length_6331_cov_21.329108_7_plen_167_part_00
MHTTAVVPGVPVHVQVSCSYEYFFGRASPQQKARKHLLCAPRQLLAGPAGVDPEPERWPAGQSGVRFEGCSKLCSIRRAQKMPAAVVSAVAVAFLSLQVAVVAQGPEYDMDKFVETYVKDGEGVARGLIPPPPSPPLSAPRAAPHETRPPPARPEPRRQLRCFSLG